MNNEELNVQTELEPDVFIFFLYHVSNNFASKDTAL